MTRQWFFMAGVSLFFTLFIQNLQAQGTKVGMRIGVLVANADVEPKNEGDPDYKNLNGFQIAMPFEIGIGKHFAIQPEIMYGFQGARVDESSSSTDLGITTTSSLKGKIQANCLEIPVLAKVFLGSEGVRFHLLAGPSVGVGLKGNANVEGTVTATTANGTVLFSETIKDDSKLKFVNDGYDSAEVGDDESPFAKANINLHLGAGLNIQLGNSILFLEARYMQGLSDLNPEASGTQEGDKYKATGKRAGLSAGIMVPLN